ncbi:MAG TPA: hypothetical protein VK069_01030 [Mycolicibacillus parakoreensis]|uniref:Transmembrane protein n=1 Tax=Mycolicibacillus parakoreensis TaxID=1069221 RepID=A0ABY3U4N4_9MYCO|nr:hypothetical protein [Mycolicibacillus parakoreensis]ULN52374.1 hypothetical protein MIU77_16275 [Mycolicibacillus parakoreensis]HLR98158.1 hypothetical protein [Mycolicibacillus parakoreensis]
MADPRDPHDPPDTDADAAAEDPEAGADGSETGADAGDSEAAVDTAALPLTEPSPAPLFDSGPFPEPLEVVDPDLDSRLDLDSGDVAPAGYAYADITDEAADAAAPARSVVVPGQYTFVKWWKLLLVLAAVWIPAGALGVGLYYWWVALGVKTPAVFVVLIYTVVCIVVGLILAMAGNRPLVAALAIAVMTAVFASVAAAAPLYGHYYCEVTVPLGGRCLAGIIPY